MIVAYLPMYARLGDYLYCKNEKIFVWENYTLSIFGLPKNTLLTCGLKIDTLLI